MGTQTIPAATTPAPPPGVELRTGGAPAPDQRTPAAPAAPAKVYSTDLTQKMPPAILRGYGVLGACSYGQNEVQKYPCLKAFYEKTKNVGYSQWTFGRARERLDVNNRRVLSVVAGVLEDIAPFVLNANPTIVKDKIAWFQTYVDNLRDILADFDTFLKGSSGSDDRTVIARVAANKVRNRLEEPHTYELNERDRRLRAMHDNACNALVLVQDYITGVLGSCSPNTSLLNQLPNLFTYHRAIARYQRNDLPHLPQWSEPDVARRHSTLLPWTEVFECILKAAEPHDPEIRAKEAAMAAAYDADVAEKETVAAAEKATADAQKAIQDAKVASGATAVGTNMSGVHQ